LNDAGLARDAERSRLTAGALLFIAILGIAAGLTRFWALGARPLHHDESIHAYQSWTLSRGGDWRYDPAYHGPFLYYVNALVYKIFGATDFTARMMPAIFGLILIGFAWPLRRWVGKPAAAVYAVLVLTSAHFTYFSRFIREDLYSLVFTFATIVAFQRFLETDRSKWLMLSATAFAFAGVTKENAYMTGVLFVAYGLWCLVRGLGSPLGPRPRAALRNGFDWTWKHLVPIVTAGVLFLVIWATMYTAFGKYPGDWLAIPKAVKYWMGQHAIARIPGPWYYYFPQLAYYDTAILLAACFAFPWKEWRRDPLLRAVLLLVPITLAAGFYSALRPEAPMLPAWGALLLALAAAVVALFVWKDPEPPATDLFVRFVAFWAVGSLAIYGWAREKVPWLTVHPLLPLTILAGLGVVRLWTLRRRPWAAVALAATGLLLVINTSGMYLAAFRYGAHDKEREPGHAEMLAYVQTSKDLVRSLAAVDTAKSRVAAGQPVVTIVGESTWPLTWYLRDVNAQWASRIDQATTPVIIGDWDPEGALEKQLAPKYDAKRVPIRAWWFPEPTKEGGVSRPTFRDGLRWWLFHEIWSPIGSQDATMYVRRDLGGSGMLEPLQLQVQDTSSRDYPSDAIELPAPRVYGPPIPGGGQFAEPRGVAADGSGNIYVADSKNSRIVVLDPNGGLLRALGTRGAGDGQVNEPSGVAVGPDGMVYVADTWNHRIVRFGPGGEWAGVWTDPEKNFFGPRSLVLSRGSLYVSDTGNKRIVRFDAATGAVTARWGTAGSGPGQFIEPVGVAADSSGRIYVADTGNHRVQVFDADGKPLRQFPVYGALPRDRSGRQRHRHRLVETPHRELRLLGRVPEVVQGRRPEAPHRDRHRRVRPRPRHRPRHEPRPFLAPGRAALKMPFQEGAQLP
jgi:uncharacterized protein (TIGR03663 family)